MAENNKDKKIDKLTEKVSQLDDICSSIYLTLLIYKKARFNELYRKVIKLNPKTASGKPFVSRPTFNDHLGHLKKKKLIVTKELGKQNVVYSLNKATMSIFGTDFEEVSKELLDWSKNLEVFDSEKHFAKLTEKDLDQEVTQDLNEVIKVNLHELRAFVEYDLKIDEKESGAEFWKFIGNPMYRMLEKGIADNCRRSPKYKEKIFEKIELLLKEKSLTSKISKEGET